MFQLRMVPFPAYFLCRGVLQMLRKFTMTCVIIFMYPEKPQQLAAGFIVTLLYLIVFIKAEPYSNPQVDKMQAASLLTQGATLFCK